MKIKDYIQAEYEKLKELFDEENEKLKEEYEELCDKAKRFNKRYNVNINIELSYHKQDTIYIDKVLDYNEYCTSTLKPYYKGDAIDQGRVNKIEFKKYNNILEQLNLYKLTLLRTKELLNNRPQYLYLKKSDLHSFARNKNIERLSGAIDGENILVKYTYDLDDELENYMLVGLSLEKILNIWGE